MPPMPSSEIKGTWFVTLQTWCARERPGSLAELERRMPKYGALIREPQQGEWYPEEGLHELFDALFEVLDRDPRAFIEASRQVSHEAVGRFFRVLLGLSSASFLLRQVPTMWKRLRRDDGATVEVESRPGESLVRYRDFPWFDHDVYVHFTIGSLTALAQLADPEGVLVELAERSPGAASFRVTHR
jgi:hypothetical protein